MFDKTVWLIYSFVLYVHPFCRRTIPVQYRAVLVPYSTVPVLNWTVPAPYLTVLYRSLPYCNLLEPYLNRSWAVLLYFHRTCRRTILEPNRFVPVPNLNVIYSRIKIYSKQFILFYLFQLLSNKFFIHETRSLLRKLVNNDL